MVNFSPNVKYVSVTAGELLIKRRRERGPGAVLQLETLSNKNNEPDLKKLIKQNR